MANTPPPATHSASESNSRAAYLSSLRNRLKDNPQDGESWLALALQLAQSTPGPELRRAISECTRLMPNNYQGWLLAGLERQHRCSALEAQQWLQQATRDYPDFAAPRLAYAQLLSAAEGDAADREFRAVIDQYPQDSRACLLYAEYLQNRRQLPKAGDYLLKALELQPAVVENWTALAKIRLAEHRFEEVVVAATRALELDPTALEARMTRAEAYRQAAQWQLAKADYQELLRAMPNNPYILMGLGASLAGEREFGQAMKVLARAVSFKPDLLEARLNIALVHACQGNSAQAVLEFQRLLASGGLPATLRESSEVCLATLREHQRLQPHLDESRRLNRLESLQSALEQAPRIMRQNDTQMEARLVELARASQQIQWPELSDLVDLVDGGEESDPLGGFVEACLVSRTASTASQIARLWRLAGSAFHGVESRIPPPLSLAWQAIRDRQSGQAPMSHGQGEAWLRYWHYRLFQESPEDFPGQFKFAPNSIGLHRTVAPQHLVPAVRHALDDIGPTLEPGFGRACYLLVAIAWIHPFVDGNGRMSRFAFSAELESAALPSLLLLTQSRKALTACQDQAQYENDFTEFARFLPQAYSSTRKLLKDVRSELESG